MRTSRFNKATYIRVNIAFVFYFKKIIRVNTTMSGFCNIVVKQEQKEVCESIDIEFNVTSATSIKPIEEYLLEQIPQMINIKTEPNDIDSDTEVNKDSAKRTRERPYSCDVCSFRCATSNGMYGHKQTHGEKNLVCNECGYKTHSRSYLITHLRRHTGERPYACNVCRCMYKTSSALAKHRKIHLEKHQKCSLCDYKTQFKDKLKSHVLKHSEEWALENDLACNLCTYRCVRRKDLVDHKQMHTVKQYQCDKCFYSSDTKKLLYNHKGKHRENKVNMVKMVKCTLCDVQVRNQRALVFHLRKHTGEKPYACNICEFKSAYPKNLVRHKRNHLDKN